MEILDNKTRKEVSYYLPSVKSASRLADFFALFSDCSRLRVISALAISRMCVTDLADVCRMNQTTVSHQLRSLKSMGIVESERQGKIVFYRLADNKINDIVRGGICRLRRRRKLIFSFPFGYYMQKFFRM